MGECLHRAEVRVPTFVIADPTDRTPAVTQAEPFPLLGIAGDDPRIPGSPVPAVVKWTNDELDQVPDLCATYFNGSALEERMRSSQSRVVDSYRRLRSQDLAVRIDGACAARATKDINVDPAADVDTAWDSDERSGLHHIVQTLTLIGSGAEVDASDSELHARYVPRGVEIVAILGSTHALCVTALKRLAARTHSPIVCVTRDANNAPHLPREAESFTDPRGGTGVRFTDAQTLLTTARSVPMEADYQQYIMELLNVSDRRII
jgi:hypothetical protein